MMATVKGRRIARGGYIAGERALVASFVVEESQVSQADEVAGMQAEFGEQLKRVRKQALEEGYTNGFAEGRKEISPQIELLKKVLQDIEAGVDTVWDACRQGTAELAMQIARKVVGAAAENHQALALDLARTGIQMAREKTKVTIYVNVQDAAALRNAEADLIAAGDGVRAIEIVERGSVPPGGVIIECEVGQFDLRPQVQLEALAKALEVEPEAVNS
jgi:flagellar assembly protein FliH